jgi:hypothetical protein
MNHSWHKRAYKEGDEHQILRLRQIVFGNLDEVRLNLSTWYWQFRDNPAGKAVCWLAENKGAVVGQYTIVPTRFCVRGQETLFAFSCDTMVHPNYRKQGIFVALANQCYQSLESRDNPITTFWGFPNKTSLIGFCRRLRWDTIAVIPLRILPIRRLAMLYRCMPMLSAQRSTDIYSKTISLTKAIAPRVPGLSIEPIHYFSADFDMLWDRHKALAPIIQIRDSIYLNWRYFGIPDFNYRAFAIGWMGELAGYIVLRFMDMMGHHFGVLVDIFPFPVIDNRLTQHVFRFARDYAEANRAEFLTCLLPWAKTSFLGGGYLKVPEKLNPRRWYFGCRCLQNDRPLLNLIQHWYISYGDTDIV